MKFRSFFNFLAIAVSLSLGILWIRSYVVGTYLQWFVKSPTHERLFGVDWGGGAVDFLYNHVDPLPANELGAKSKFTFTSVPVAATNDDFADHSDSTTGFMWLQRLGFVYRSSELPDAQFHTLEVPFWAMTVLSLIMLAPVFLRWRTLRRRRLRNQCRNCGYDLRASTNCCPECGTSIHIEPLERGGNARVIAVIVAPLVIVGAFCWYCGDIFGRRDVARADDVVRAAEDSHFASERINVPPRVDQAAWRREHAAIELSRRSYFSVDYVRLSVRSLENSGMGPNARLWSEIEFQLTNRSDKLIDGTRGMMELYGPDHRLLASVGWGSGLSLEPGHSCSGSFAFALDAATRLAMASGRVTAEYRAAFIRYPDNKTVTFGEGSGGFLSTTASK